MFMDRGVYPTYLIGVCMCVCSESEAADWKPNTKDDSRPFVSGPSEEKNETVSGLSVPWGAEHRHRKTAETVATWVKWKRFNTRAQIFRLRSFPLQGTGLLQEATFPPPAHPLQPFTPPPLHLEKGHRIFEPKGLWLGGKPRLLRVAAYYFTPWTAVEGSPGSYCNESALAITRRPADTPGLQMKNSTVSAGAVILKSSLKADHNELCGPSNNLSQCCCIFMHYWESN